MKKIILCVFTLILLLSLRSNAYAERGIATPTPTVSLRSTPTPTPIPSREPATETAIPTPTTAQANRIVLTPTLIPFPTSFPTRTPSPLPNQDKVINLPTTERNSQEKIETIIEESETMSTEDDLKIFFEKLPMRHKSSDVPVISAEDKKVKLSFNKKVKLLGIFDVNLTKEVEADVISGQIKVKEPWWNFLLGDKSALKDLEKIQPKSFLQNINSNSSVGKEAKAGLILYLLSDEDTTGDRHFFVDESEAIRFDSISISPVEDSPIGD